MIIDVDSHWEAVSYHASEHPLAPWADHLPSGVDMLAFGVAGDLLRALPESERPAAASCSRARAKGGDAADRWCSTRCTTPRPRSGWRGWTASGSTTAS